jgi:hypothetical protein
MTKTTAIVAKARIALREQRAELMAQLAYFDRVLAALNGVRPGRKATRRTATPKQLANLRKARRALKAKRAAAR